MKKLKSNVLSPNSGFMLLYSFLIIFSLSYCDNNDSAPNTSNKISSTDGQLQVIIPKSATENNNVSIQIDQIPLLGRIGSTYSINADQNEFNDPVTLTFKYDENSLPEGLDPEDLKVAFRKDESKHWEVMPFRKLDKLDQTISVSTTHFSDWGLVGEGHATLSIPTKANLCNSLS